MSVHVLSWVLRHSEAKLGGRLVLISLAEHADEDGTAAYPSVETIARDARLSKRAVQYALRALIADGAIEQCGKSQYGTTVYRVVMEAPAAVVGADPAGADIARGVQSTTETTPDSAPEPSYNPPITSEANASEDARPGGSSNVVDFPAASDPVTDLFDHWRAACGHPRARQ